MSKKILFVCHVLSHSDVAMIMSVCFDANWTEKHTVSSNLLTNHKMGAYLGKGTDVCTNISQVLSGIFLNGLQYLKG